MTADDLETYLRGIGYDVTVETGADNVEYSVVHKVVIPAGGLAGRVCDVALLRHTGIPYAVPAAIHTRPALVPMDMTGPLKTQASGIGPEWQYWSRRYDRVPAPKTIWTHVLTVFAEVQKVAA
jgi:hypothetical protein